MKSLTKIIILLITAIAFTGCSGDSFLKEASKKSEHVLSQRKHTNGNIASESYLLEGVKDGMHKEWFPNGKLQLERTYEMGEIVAEKLYTIEGEIIKNIVIKDGRKYGLLFSSFCINGVAKNPESDSLIFKSKEQ